MVIDVITYNGEYDLFDLRYNILKDHVDQFIVVEFDKTFSGKEKPWYFDDISSKYDKVSHCKITQDTYNKYTDLALSSPNTEYGKGAEHWVREFCQKESIKDCLTHLQDDDIVCIGDCDEILDLKGAQFDNVHVWKAKLLVYTYYLNQRSSEEFYGPIVSAYKNVKKSVLNYLRSDISTKAWVCPGWHFTSLKDGLRRKLEDSYTNETYATDAIS